DLGDVEIGPDRVPLLPDPVRLIGLQPMLGVAVLVREHRHGLRAELVGGAESTDCDLAAVGDKHLSEHSNSFLPAPVHDATCGTGPLYKWPAPQHAGGVHGARASRVRTGDYCEQHADPPHLRLAPGPTAARRRSH